MRPLVIGHSRRPIAPLIKIARAAKVPFLLVVGYLLAATLANPTIQDAFQYRVNLETGVYEREETSGYFGAFVTWVSGVLPGLDPFFVVGGVTAAAYLYVSLKEKAPPKKYLFFLLLLVMPLVSLNFTQVLRQGLASALILIGLTAGSTIVFAVCLIFGAIVHKVFAPVVAVMLMRQLFFLRKNANSMEGDLRRTRQETLFDLVVLLMIPVAWILILLFSEVFLSRGLYITYELDNAKRVIVSLLLLACVRLIYPSLTSRLSTFMAYLAVSVAVVLPVAVDFLRLQTVVAPFIAIAALRAGGGRNSYYALAIVLVVSVYVMPVFGLQRIF